MRRLRKDQAGFTLVELLVVVVILGAVSAGIYRALDNIQSTSSGAAERVINLDEGRVLMDTLTKDFRTATRLTSTSLPMESADWQSATFYARLNTTGQPVRLHVSLDAEGRLQEQITDPVCAVGTTPCPDDQWTYPGPARTRIVGRWVDKTIAVFKYYDIDGNQIVPSPSQSSSLSTLQKSAVRAVEITLKIRRTPNIGATPTTLINRVRLPNID
jgi:prepilin-type N-terminal cleavage/methylation domain-containing protein